MATTTESPNGVLSTSVNVRKEEHYMEDDATSSIDDGLGPHWQFWNRRRYVVGILAFFGFFSVYALRVNLSVAIVAMTEYRNETLENGTTILTRDFDWDSKTHGLVLSSFFYGYIVTQIPGGWLAGRFGGNRVYGIGVAVTALFTLLTPPLARANVYLLVVARVIEGLFEGVTYPCMHAVWARWAPPFERSQLVSRAASGAHVGTVVSLPLSGILAHYFGWASVFYVFGTLVMIWFFFWWIIVKSGPEEDPRISPEELKYIQKFQSNVSHKDVVHPWGKILTSSAVWAIVIANFSENWGFYTLLTQLPTFMGDVLSFKLEKSGFMSAVPYLVMAIVLQFSGRMADWLQVRGFLTTTQVRKLFNSGAFVCQTVFMLLAAFLLTPVGAVVCLSIAVGLGGFAFAGYFVNHLDIAPQHAGVLMGLSNMVATLPGIISPLLTGYVVQHKNWEFFCCITIAMLYLLDLNPCVYYLWRFLKDNIHRNNPHIIEELKNTIKAAVENISEETLARSKTEWQIVFYIASGIYLIGAVVYAIYASGELQSWAKEDENKSKNGNAHCYTNKTLET